MNKRVLIIACCAVFSSSTGTFALEKKVETAPSDYEARRKADVDAYFRKLTTYGGRGMHRFWAGFARLWLNDDLELGNQKIREDLMRLVREMLPASKAANVNALTPEMIGANQKVLSWRMDGLIAAYCLFSDKSDRFPGRLDAENQKLLEKLMWGWLHSPRHQIGALKESRYNPKNALVILGTENGETPRFPATLLAAQIVKNLPEYKGKKLPPSGDTPEVIYNGMKTFLNAKCDGMAKHGLLVEAFTSYNAYTMQPFYNIVDFCEGAALREKTAMLLDTIWAEWAVGSINGVRGGGKCRKYGVGSGTGDPWFVMAEKLFDFGPWHGEATDTPLLASTRYRVPAVIQDIAKDHVGKGEYVYVGKRFAKVRPSQRDGWDDFEPVDTRALAYDYVTPDFVMGSLLLDPTLTTTREQGGYSPLFTQNMLISIIFATNLDARICPRGFGGKSYLQYHTVQHENVMVVQKHPRSENVKLMQVYFSKGMKERLVEKEGWRFLQEGAAYVAVKAFSSKDGKAPAPCTWADDSYLKVDDPDAPIVFILGRKAKHGTLEAFQKYVLGSSTGLKGKEFTVSTVDAHDKPLELGLLLDGSAIPLVNGKPINFLPERVFDSPFFQSKHGSGIVTIQKGDRKRILDFNTSTVTDQKTKPTEPKE